MHPAIRRPLNAALLCLALAFALGFAVTAGLGKPVDVALFKALALREATSPGWAIDLARWITWFGDAGQRGVLMAGFAGWLLWRQRVRAALVMLVFPALAGALSSVLKEAFGRARIDLVPHLDHFGDLSYPSGHAANGMAILLMAALLVPQTSRRIWLTAALGGAAAIGLSRIWLGVHWPSDVLGGWLCGAALALFGLAAARRLEG